MNYAQQSQTYFNLTNLAMRRLQGKKILIVGASNEELDVPSSSYGLNRRVLIITGLLSRRLSLQGAKDMELCLLIVLNGRVITRLIR